jgi:glutaconyl-CoA/methylmalonyl-CoA decarboxylase subunit gamma
VNGTQYEVELQKTKSRPELSIKKPTLNGQNLKGNGNGQKVNGVHAIKAPLPGVVMKVFVNEGDMVEENEQLLIYEAMKMENEIKSDKAGKVKSVKVKASDSILQDDVLIEIE